MSIAAPSHLLFSSTLPVTGVESVRRLHNDRTSLIIDAICIRKRAMHHRSRAFVGVFFGSNYPLNTAYDLPTPYYRTKDESVMALSAIFAALKQLLLGLGDSRFADRRVKTVIIRTNCTWTVHLISSRAMQRQSNYRGGGAGRQWHDDRAQTALARLAEDSIRSVQAKGIQIKLWNMDSNILAEATLLAKVVAGQRSQMNVMEFKIWLQGVGKKCRGALGILR
ncbi:hypothetical protein ONS95_010633 [Cadophora gregata]|uniref:uncharacterized protein n=1 Tax=Cadophora gregata TaxID=51156 RepID=UPI0026DBA7F3|nr:uncharacterized protein ONS95_010633 [Cadophora gregata]KAK0122393.1 hypothetical protein ONS95_010633 [Cadophora gregata]KAK0127872.1 hypothetical protein ONS96_007373 [Cadophora gregata f. sp. sojae]